MIGIVGLLKSRKGTLSLLILVLASSALLLGKLDSTQFAAIIATIAVIYNFTQGRIDMMKGK